MPASPWPLARRRAAFASRPRVADAVADADLIVEAVPERLDVKRRVYAEAEAAAKPDALIASSTSGILPSDLQAEMTRPGRLLVAHPFNPVYLLPVVEIVGGRLTDPAADRPRDGLLSDPRHEARAHPQGDRGLRRRPPARIDLARGALADQDGICTTRGARRHRALRLRHPLRPDGRLRHLPRRRRRGRHAALHGPVRPLPDMALDASDRRAGVRRRPRRPHRRPVGRAIGPHPDPRAGAHPRRQPRRHPAGAQGQRLGRRPHPRRLREAALRRRRRPGPRRPLPADPARWSGRSRPTGPTTTTT